MKVIDERKEYLKLEEIKYKHKIYGGRAFLGLSYDEMMKLYFVTVFKINEFNINETHYITETNLATYHTKNEKEALIAFENSLNGEFCSHINKR